MKGPRFLAIAALTLISVSPVLAQAGSIDGKVTRDNGKGVGGVTVVLSELGRVDVTGNGGEFRFVDVPAGSYNLSFSLGDNADSATVDVAAGTAARVDQVVDWDVSFAETITVYSASRRRERIVDAPASVTLVTQEDLGRESATGQLAKVLEFAPGVEVTQSGVADFNLNTRGFNSSLNRRVQVLVDGRDPSVPFLGSTEWSYLSNMDNAASVELVRGPSSALYGANAFNGVLNMVTKAPRDIDGGRGSLSGGELASVRGDFSLGTGLGESTFLKLAAMYQEGESFYRSRVGQIEYPGLPFELVSVENEYDWTNFSVRLDQYLRGEKDLLTGEFGLFETDANGVTVTGIGRVAVQESERTFLRLNYSTPRLNILAYQNSRETPDQIALASGGRIFLDTENSHIEIQGNYDFNGGKVRFVGGASYRETEIDTANDSGIQTLIFRPVESDASAVFGQVDFLVSDSLKLVVAARYDESSLHDSQVSPKAALVWSINSNHTMRFSYNEAFQVANYSEFFLDAPTALPTPGGPLPSINLGAIEAGLCAPFGISCGFGTPTGFRALGNANLDLEEITAYEIGYTGIFGSKAFLTVDYYQNELENFITDLSVNPFGSINPDFGPYRAPANHPAPDLLVSTLAGALGPSLFPFLSNNVDGSPIFALVSYTNAGSVDTEGIDMGLNYYITPEWLFDFTYSWFDFKITDLAGARESELLPNAPENKYSLGITYNAADWGFSLKYRWTEGFLWAAGSFNGAVEDYDLVNLNAHYQINDRIRLGLNVSNLFDDEHYQSFGGDLLGRRALGSITFNW